MKDEPEHLLHKDDQAAPPVIHHHDDETLLARWLRRGMQKGAAFWLLLSGLIAALAAVIYLLNVLANRTPPEADAWLKVIVPSATGPVSSSKYEGMPTAVRPLLAAADEHPRTPAAAWALYQAASYLYQEGLRELPANRDAGKPSLTQAAELYERALKDAAADSPVRKFAQLGLARTLETRGELTEAREAYLKVASTWPDAPEATTAKRRAEQLADPEVQKFYQAFATENFSTFTPAGSAPAAGADAGLPTGTPGLTRPLGSSLYPPAIPESFQGAPTQPAGADAPRIEAPAEPAKADAPAPAPADAPKVEAPAETPKAEAPAAPVEAPKVETPAPAEAPKTEAPAEAPKAAR